MKVKVAQSCLILCDPTDYTVHGILQARIFSLLQVIEPSFPPLQVTSLPAEPQGTPKNTGVGSLSLLQQIFLTQESNKGLLHCRWILYQLSYQGSPQMLAWLLIINKPLKGELQCKNKFSLNFLFFLFHSVISFYNTSVPTKYNLQLLHSYLLGELYTK